MSKLFTFLTSILATVFTVGSVRAEATQAQLTDMMKQSRYVFHVNRPTTPPRELDVIFDLNGLHIIDQSKEIFSRSWVEIEKVYPEDSLIVTHFKSGADFSVPKSDLGYQGVVDYFLVFALKQIVDARIKGN